MKTIFLALAIQCYISLTFSQAFEITRPGHGRDVFNIPASMCNRNAADSGRGCKTFYAVNGERNCSCLCPARNATFAFYNKGWSCVENRKLRRYLDRDESRTCWCITALNSTLNSLNCTAHRTLSSSIKEGPDGHELKCCEFVTSFSVETADRRLPTLAFGQRREMSLHFPLWEYWRCSLDIRKSWFKGCWGSKQFLRHYKASVKLFTITRSRSTAPYFLKVNRNIPNTDIFRGKIFNLILDCRVFRRLALGFNFHTRNCLLFKLQGNTTCPVNNATVTVSSTIHPLETSSIVSSTSRITASQAFTNAAVFLGSTSVSIVTHSSNSHTIVSKVSTYLGTQPTITEIPTTTSAAQSTVTEISPTASTSQPVISKVSTYLGTQPTFSKISPTATTSELTISGVLPKALVTQTTVTEISPTVSTSQPAISKVSTYLGTQLTFSEISPTASASEMIVSGVLPTALITQSTVSENSPRATQSIVSPTTSTATSSEPAISEVLPTAYATQPSVTDISTTAIATQSTAPELTPITSNTHPTVSDMSPTATTTSQPTIIESLPPTRDTQPTTSEISTRAFHTQPSVTEVSQTELNSLPPSTEISPTAPITQATVPGILPTESDALPTVSEILPTEPDVQPTISEISPTKPDTQPAVSETSRKSPKDPDTSQKPSILLPQTPDIEPTTLPSNVPPTLSPDREGKTDKNSSVSVALIAGVPILVIIIAAIIVCCVYRRRHSNKRLRSCSVTGSEMTMDTIVMSPQVSRAHQQKDERGYYTLDFKDPPSFEIPGYDVPHSVINSSFEEEDKASRLHDPLGIVQPQPGNNNKQIDNVLKEPVKNSEQNTVHVLEDKEKGAYGSSSNKDPMYYVLEGPYPEGTEGPGQPDTNPLNDPEEPIYCSLDEVFTVSSGIPCPDPNSEDESLYNVLEIRKISSNDQIFNPSDKPDSDTNNNNTNDTEYDDEPLYDVLERRYFGGSKVPPHYVQMSPNVGPIFKPKGSFLEDRLLEGSDVPEHYVRISPSGLAFGTLDRIKRASLKESNNYPERGSEPVGEILEGCYLEGSEVPENYVRVSSNAPVLSILERLYRQSVKGSTRDTNSTREPVDKASSRDPKCEDEPNVDNLLEESYLEGSEVPENYVRVSPNGPVFSILERLYRQSVKGSRHDPNSTSEPVGKGSSHDPKCADEPAVDNILEEHYLEGSEVPENYVRVSPNGPVFSILERLYRKSIKGSTRDPNSASEPVGKGSSHDPKCADEAVGNIVEECYLEGSEVPENYERITPNGPVFSILEKLYRQSIKGSNYKPKCADGPDDKTLEGRYFEGSEVPTHYVQVSPNGPDFSTLEKLSRNSVRRSTHGPKSSKETMDKILEERYLQGSKVPEQYMWISRKGSAFKTLHRLYRNSVRRSNYDPECVNKREENVLEGRYLEGSDVPEHYVRISRDGSVFSIVEKVNRPSVKGSNHGSERSDEPGDNILEGRYFEGSKIPEQYARIGRKGSVFSIVEKSNRNSVKVPSHDPERADEPGDSILEGRYFEGSEIPEQYVRIARKGSVFSIVERSNRNSVKGPNHDPERTDEPGDILEVRYLEGSKVPEQYMWVSRKGSTLKTLDKSNRNSLKGSNHDPELEDEPVDNILEGRYFEGSDVPQHYVRISRDGSVFSIVEKSNRNSVTGSNHNPKADEPVEPVDSILEGRYFEGSEVPEKYVRIGRKGSIFSIVEKVNRISVKGLNHDPERPEEPGDNILEGRYFEGSDVPEEYVQVAPNGPVFSILEKLYRKSIKGFNYDPKGANGSDDKTLEDDKSLAKDVIL